MANTKFILTRGIGFLPGSLKYIPTLGFISLVVVTDVENDRREAIGVLPGPNSEIGRADRRHVLWIHRDPLEAALLGIAIGILDISAWVKLKDESDWLQIIDESDYLQLEKDKE